jgi:phosphoribosylformylglycinamidine cyclo-ligase
MLVAQTISRNKALIDGDVIQALMAGCHMFCQQMNELGFPMLYATGETQDIGDLTRTIAVDNTIATRIKRNEVIDASRMAPGDAIIGYSSTGRAKWEPKPNSGIGSNGLTDARHNLLSGRFSKPEHCAPQTDPKLVYRGNYALSDPLPGDPDFTIGSALLSPTRTYLPLLKKLFELVSLNDIHGIIHCSGGGQTKIKKFGKPGNVYIKDNLFPVPPFFRLLQEVDNVPWKEMYKVYNMGHRLEVVVPDHAIEACLEAGKWAGIDARCVGRVGYNKRLMSQVIIRTSQGTFDY